MLKRKASNVDSPASWLTSPSPGTRSRVKRPRHILWAQFDDEEFDEMPLMDLLNLKLSGTNHRAVCVRNEDCAKLDQTFVGAFVYYCSSSQTDHVWRSVIASHFFQRRFGPLVYLRACQKPNKRIRDEDLDDEEFVRNLDKIGGFGSPQALDSCVIIPVTSDMPSSLLFRGSAVANALGLVNEPLYYRKGWLPWESFCDQDSHKREAQVKVEKVNGEVGLYELYGIKWKRIVFD